MLAAISRRVLVSSLLVYTSSVVRLGAVEPPTALSLLPDLEDGFRRLYLVRHGETAWNVAGRIQGKTDNPLNDNGRRQARLLADYLASEPLDVVASSTLQRAATTADAIAERHATARRLRLASFSEMCFGEYEGQEMSAVELGYRDALKAWASGDTDRTMPGKGGESPAMVAARGVEGLRSLGLVGESPTTARRVCVVAHSRFNKILIASLQGDLSKASSVAQGNTCLNVLDVSPDGRCVVRAVNLREHLLPDGTAALRDPMALGVSRSRAGVAR